MTRDEMATGRLLIDDDGVITECNAQLALIVRTSRAALIGTPVLKITAHADRDRCVAIFHQIRADGVAVMTTRRIVRADRTHVWVRIAVTTPSWPDSGEVRMIVEECAAPDGWVEPATLLKIAGGMVRARHARTTTFGGELFGDFAWDLLLAAYIAESEGAVVSSAALPAMIGLPAPVTMRWLRALHSGGLIDYEDQAEGAGSASIRLSGAAHRKFERFLSDLYRDSARLDLLPPPPIGIADAEKETDAG